MDFTDAVKAYYDVCAEFKLLRTSKTPEKYLVTLNTELYYLNLWFRNIVFGLRRNYHTSSPENIDTTLYPMNDWKIFTETKYSDPNSDPGDTFDQQLRHLLKLMVSLLKDIEQTPWHIAKDVTFDYVISTNMVDVTQYMGLFHKYLEYLTHIRMFPLMRQATIEYMVDQFRKQQSAEELPSETNTHVIEKTLTLASNPLRRAMEYMDFTRDSY
jgi:hypothetical protein